MSVGRWLVFDAIALGAYAFAANPAVTGIPVHEIVGAAVLVVFLVHCAQHVEVVAETIKGALSSRRAFRAANVALDALIVIALMVCIVSGFLSRTVFRWLVYMRMDTFSGVLCMRLLLTPFSAAPDSCSSLFPHGHSAGPEQDRG